MKKFLLFSIIAILFTSCIGQNAPFENGIVKKIELLGKNNSYYYIEIDSCEINYSFTMNNTYISTSENKFIIGDTVVFISKRELRKIINCNKLKR